MKSRPILIIILSISLLLVCALCALTGYSTYSWLNRQPGGFRLWNVNPISAQVQESRDFEVAGAATLEIYSDAGDITVTAAEVDQIEVEMTRTAWGASEEDAQVAAKALPVTITQDGDQLTIRFEQPENITLLGNSGGLESVDFTIRVPVETSVKLETHFGEISLTGTTGRAELTGSFGNLSAFGVTGALEMRSSQADLDVTSVNAGTAAVTLETSFGDINVQDLAAGDTTLSTSNGALHASQLELSGSLTVENQFGETTLEQVDAETLDITSSNGKVEVTTGTLDGELHISNTFGDITVRETTAASYTLETSNGELSLEDCRGEINLTNSFGDILVSRAEAAILNITTTNGKIAFSGSLDPTAAHSLENSFGDIQLAIPADSVLDIEFETQFGEIDSEMPITVSGELSPTSLRGTLNGGGALLKATTSNGDISLIALAGER